MIIMDVMLDNIYAFKDFHINFSYPKKIVGSYIEDEHLQGKPNFRYKKVNIIMGANATGKTTFGHALRDIFNFIDKRNPVYIIDSVGNPKKKATFTIEMIFSEDILYRIHCEIPPYSEDYEGDSILVWVDSVPIGKKDSYETCNRKLNEIPKRECGNFIEELDKVGKLYWLFEHPSEINKPISLPKGDPLFVKILNTVLTSLDPAIVKVEKVKNIDDAYAIHLKDKAVILQDNEVFATNVLSSGTKAGVEVAKVISALLQGKNSFYYCDEKFSYIHSDIEKAILGVMIDSIRPDEQLFFTTHNTEILEMNLPKHAYTFMKKDIYEPDHSIRCLSASDFLKRNTDSLKKAVENDLFSVAPATDKIYEIVSYLQEK